MEFIDSTGHIFSLPSYEDNPISLQYTENDYIFWIKDSSVSVNNYYIKPIRFLLDYDEYVNHVNEMLEESDEYGLNELKDAFDINVTIESQFYKLIGPKYIQHKLEQNKDINEPIQFNLDDFKSELILDDFYYSNINDDENIIVEAGDENRKFLLFPFYVIGKSDIEGTYLSNVNIKVSLFKKNETNIKLTLDSDEMYDYYMRRVVSDINIYEYNIEDGTKKLWYTIPTGYDRNFDEILYPSYDLTIEENGINYGLETYSSLDEIPKPYKDENNQWVKPKNVGYRISHFINKKLPTNVFVYIHDIPMNKWLVTNDIYERENVKDDEGNDVLDEYGNIMTQWKIDPQTNWFITKKDINGMDILPRENNDIYYVIEGNFKRSCHYCGSVLSSNFDGGSVKMPQDAETSQHDTGLLATEYYDRNVSLKDEDGNPLYPEDWESGDCKKMFINTTFSSFGSNKSGDGYEIGKATEQGIPLIDLGDMMRRNENVDMFGNVIRTGDQIYDKRPIFVRDFWFDIDIKLDANVYNYSLQSNYTPITVGCTFVDECEELIINGRNMGIHLPKEILKAIYSSSFYSKNADEKLLRNKMKELLLNYMNIKGETGNFKSMLNSLKWFGWQKYINISQLIKTDNQFQNQFILDYFNINNDIKDTFKYFNKTNNISLTVPANKETGDNYIQDFTNIFFGEGKPILENLFEKNLEVIKENIIFYKPYYRFIFDELALKLDCLKYYYQQYFLPVHININRASIDHKVYANTTKLSTVGFNTIVDKPLYLPDDAEKVSVIFPDTHKQLFMQNDHIIDDKFNEFSNYNDNFNGEDLYYVNENNITIPITFIYNDYEYKQSDEGLYFINEKNEYQKISYFYVYDSDGYTQSNRKEATHYSLIENYDIQSLNNVRRYNKMSKLYSTDNYGDYYMDFDGNYIKINYFYKVLTEDSVQPSNRFNATHYSDIKNQDIKSLDNIERFSKISEGYFGCKILLTAITIDKNPLGHYVKIDNKYQYKNNFYTKDFTESSDMISENDITDSGNYIKFYNKFVRVNPDDRYDIKTYTLINNNSFNFYQTAYQYYKNLVIVPRLLNINIDYEKAYFRLSVLVNNKWFNYDFRIATPNIYLDLGKLEYKYELKGLEDEKGEKRKFRYPFRQLRSLSPLKFNSFMYEPDLITIDALFKEVDENDNSKVLSFLDKLLQTDNGEHNADEEKMYEFYKKYYSNALTVPYNKKYFNRIHLFELYHNGEKIKYENYEDYVNNNYINTYLPKNIWGGNGHPNLDGINLFDSSHDSFINSLINNDEYDEHSTHKNYIWYIFGFNKDINLTGNNITKYSINNYYNTYNANIASTQCKSFIAICRYKTYTTEIFDYIEFTDWAGERIEYKYQPTYILNNYCGIKDNSNLILECINYIKTLLINDPELKLLKIDCRMIHPNINEEYSLDQFNNSNLYTDYIQNYINSHQNEYDNYYNNSYNLYNEYINNLYINLFNNDCSCKLELNESINYDYYLMHDNKEWYMVVISQYPIASYIDSDLLDIHKTTYNVGSYKFIYADYSIDKFLVNRMTIKKANGYNHFNVDDFIIVTLNNNDYQFNIDLNNKWTIQSMSDIKNVYNVNSNTNIMIIPNNNINNLYTPGYYNVRLHYTINGLNNILHTAFAQFRVLDSYQTIEYPEIIEQYEENIETISIDHIISDFGILYENASGKRKISTKIISKNEGYHPIGIKVVNAGYFGPEQEWSIYIGLKYLDADHPDTGYSGLEEPAITMEIPRYGFNGADITTIPTKIIAAYANAEHTSQYPRYGGTGHFYIPTDQIKNSNSTDGEFRWPVNEQARRGWPTNYSETYCFNPLNDDDTLKTELFDDTCALFDYNGYANTQGIIEAFEYDFKSFETSGSYNIGGHYPYNIPNSGSWEDYVSADGGWKTSKRIYNNNNYDINFSPMAACAWRYHTIATQQGDWYVPAYGEVMCMSLNYQKLSNLFEQIAEEYPEDCNPRLFTALGNGNTAIWSSTQYNANDAWEIHPGDHLHVLSKSTSSWRTIPYIRINDKGLTVYRDSDNTITGNTEHNIDYIKK